VDKAVNSVFAALIWHSQDIREELLPFGKSLNHSPIIVLYRYIIVHVYMYVYGRRNTYCIYFEWQ